MADDERIDPDTDDTAPSDDDEGEVRYIIVGAVKRVMKLQVATTVLESELPEPPSGKAQRQQPNMRVETQVMERGRRATGKRKKPVALSDIYPKG